MICAFEASCCDVVPPMIEMVRSACADELMLKNPCLDGHDSPTNGVVGEVMQSLFQNWSASEGGVARSNITWKMADDANTSGKGTAQAFQLCDLPVAHISIDGGSDVSVERINDLHAWQVALKFFQGIEDMKNKMRAPQVPMLPRGCMPAPDPRGVEAPQDDKPKSPEELFGPRPEVQAPPPPPAYREGLSAEAKARIQAEADQLTKKIEFCKAKLLEVISAYTGRLDRAALISDFAQLGCTADQKTVDREIQVAVSTATMKKQEECLAASQSQRLLSTGSYRWKAPATRQLNGESDVPGDDLAKSCQTEAQDWAAELLGLSGKGAKQKLATEAASQGAADQLAVCLNSTDVSDQSAKELCYAAAQATYVSAGGSAEDFQRNVLKQAMDSALTGLVACFDAAGVTDSITLAKYNPARMSVDVASSFLGCIDLAQENVMLLLGIAMKEADFVLALKKRQQELAASAMHSCVGSPKECQQQAMQSLQQGGIDPGETRKRMMDAAAEEAVEVFKSCMDAGGVQTDCIAESRETFLSLGGKEAQFNSFLAEAKRKAVADTVGSCREMAGSDATALKDCNAQAKKAFQDMGGDASLYKAAVQKAAGQKAAQSLQLCAQEAQGNPVALQECRSKAKEVFVANGADPRDFAKQAKKGAESSAVNTKLACLEDAGCSSPELGQSRQCANETKAAECEQVSRELLMSSLGKVNITATELKKAESRVRANAIQDELSGCVTEKLSSGEVKDRVGQNCSIDTTIGYCKLQASKLCKDVAKAAFLSAGGSQQDFKVEQKKAAQGALMDQMKGCLETVLDSGNVTLPGEGALPDHVCSSDDKDVDLDKFQLCSSRARKECDEQSRLKLIEMGGSVEEYAQNLALAAASDLSSSASTCVDTLMADDSMTYDLMLSSFCEASNMSGGLSPCLSFDGVYRAARRSCTSGGASSSRRLQESSSASVAAQDFLMAGGRKQDLEMQDRRQARAELSETFMACQRVSDTELAVQELEAGNIDDLASFTMPGGKRDGQCLNQLQEGLSGLGLSKSEMMKEKRSSAALQSAERMRACLEESGYDSIETIEDDPDSFNDVKAECFDNMTVSIQEAGGLQGDMHELLKKGAEQLASEAVRECVVKANQDAEIDGQAASESDLATCRDLFGSSLRRHGVMNLTNRRFDGGDSKKIKEHRARGARSLMIDRTKACFVTDGLDMEDVWQLISRGSDEEKQQAASHLASCLRAAQQELELVLGSMTDKEKKDAEDKALQEAGADMLKTMIDSASGTLDASFDEAVDEVSVVSGLSAADAEEMLAMALGCSLDLLPCEQMANGTVVKRLAGHERCCTVGSQHVSLGGNSSAMPGAGAVELSGSGQLTWKGDELREFCAGLPSIAAEDVCTNVFTTQTALSLEARDSELLDASSADLDIGVGRLGTGSILDFGSSSEGRALTTSENLTTSEKSGRIKFDRSQFTGPVRVTGPGRLDLGGALFAEGGELELQDTDAAVRSLESVPSSKVKTSAGRLILAPQLTDNGSMESAVHAEIVVSGQHGLLAIDGAKDEQGTLQGSNEAQLIAQEVKGNVTLLVEHCSRRCRKNAAVQTAEQECNSQDARKPKTNKSWASEADGIDCGKAAKACTRSCFQEASGSKAPAKVNMSKVALQGGARVAAGFGMKLDIEELSLKSTDDAPVLSAAPSDAEGGPALIVRSISSDGLSSEGDVLPKLRLGCDLLAAADESSAYEASPCAEVHMDVNVTELHVLLKEFGRNVVRGRRIVKLAGRQDGAISSDAGESRRLATGQASPPGIVIEDDNGGDLSSLYRTCCFADGYGTDYTCTSLDVCPLCAGEPVPDSCNFPTTTSTTQPTTTTSLQPTSQPTPPVTNTTTHPAVFRRTTTSTTTTSTVITTTTTSTTTTIYDGPTFTAAFSVNVRLGDFTKFKSKKYAQTVVRILWDFGAVKCIITKVSFKVTSSSVLSGFDGSGINEEVEAARAQLCDTLTMAGGEGARCVATLQDSGGRRLQAVSVVIKTELHMVDSAAANRVAALAADAQALEAAVVNNPDIASSVTVSVPTPPTTEVLVDNKVKAALVVGSSATALAAALKPEATAFASALSSDLGTTVLVEDISQPIVQTTTTSTSVQTTAAPRTTDAREDVEDKTVVHADDGKADDNGALHAVAWPRTTFTFVFVMLCM
eukprot:TRINITY_DN60771_c0_g1_i1.p1 TRINITY_DN60771_c0_g1~~TRINITY_DN60771_c0_g1_i1.p1  ORF type:complete len:2169 (+),score=565.81 TRINITY_DN60771_c0_g1_i1:1-6507(+)